jgi:C-terminal processing protease CtpA/Prc
MDPESGREQSLDLEWLVSYSPPDFDDSEEEFNATMVAYGFDYDTLSVNQMKANLYSDVSKKNKIKKKSSWIRPANYPKSMKGKIVNEVGSNLKAGYIRIFSFAVSNAEKFVDDFIALLERLEAKNIEGLILDIRGNGGGLITASELLMAYLVGRKMEFQKAQFINSELTLSLCEKYDATNEVIDLSNWARSIGLSKRTGDYYSAGYPMTTLKRRKDFQKGYKKPMVLITDALCYSASDMFAAGFQDHHLGKVIGTHANTGAGGANVWNHETLRKLLQGTNVDYTGLTKLPKAANFNFAVRRILRRNGDPIEDLGIVPDIYHKITKNDLLQENKDLISKALRAFAASGTREEVHN